MLRVITATNARLIGNNYKLITACMGRTCQVENAINKFKVLNIINIAMIYINHTIPVEKNCPFLVYDKNSLMYIFQTKMTDLASAYPLQRISR